MEEKKLPDYSELNDEMRNLPTAPIVINEAHNFRMNHINEIKKYFENEIEMRRKTLQKYLKAFNSIHWLNNGFSGLGVLTGTAGAIIFGTVALFPVVLGLEVTAACLACLSICCNVGSKTIIKKINKHEKIHTLAIGKLNTINDLVSKALNDNIISELEFKLILAEKEKYITMKNKIRKETRNENKNINTNIDIEQLKKDFLEQGKKLATKELLEKLVKKE